jgi:hypothetical protein
MEPKRGVIFYKQETPMEFIRGLAANKKGSGGASCL